VDASNNVYVVDSGKIAFKSLIAMVGSLQNGVLVDQRFIISFYSFPIEWILHRYS